MLNIFRKLVFIPFTVPVGPVKSVSCSRAQIGVHVTGPLLCSYIFFVNFDMFGEEKLDDRSCVAVLAGNVKRSVAEILKMESKQQCDL